MTRPLPRLNWDAVEIRPTTHILQPLLETIRAERHTREEVRDILATDPMVSARVLAIANSPLVRGDAPIRTIEGAIARLGEQEICRIVMTLSAEAVRTDEVPGYGHEGGALFRSALTTASIAEQLAPACEVSWGEAFTAALLVDVGKLVVGPLLASRDAAALDGDAPFDERERALLGHDHAAVGAALLQHWGLPPSIVDAVASHHAPRGDESDPRLADLVHFADAVAAGVVDRSSRDGLCYQLDEGSVDRLALSPTEVEQAVVGSFASVARILSLTSRQGA